MARDFLNFIIYDIHDKKLREYAEKYFKGKLIDIGCGIKPYKKLLSDLVDEHIGVDHFETLHNKENIDLFGTAYNIPSNENEYDSALCTAVLEHLEEPSNAIKECYRVLKPGGFAIYSVPFIWHLHEEPRDFYRYSKYGLKYLFEKEGFNIIKIDALSGFWVTFGVLFNYNLYRYNRGILKYIPIIPITGYIIQKISYLLNKIDKSEIWTWMYMVVVQKGK
jgi:SAM-dependent methyltransferase